MCFKQFHFPNLYIGNSIKYMEMNWYCLKLPRRTMNWWQNNSDVIRTGDGTCDLFCVLPCFVATGKKCILSCDISPIGANSPLNESNEKLRTKHLCFSVVSRLRNQSRDRFGVTTTCLRRTKIKTTLSSTGKRPTTQIQVAVGKPGWPGGEVERTVPKVRRLRQETGKAVTRQLKGKVPDTSFLIDRSILPEPYVWIFCYYLFA